jgi:hypothetical protein
MSSADRLLLANVIFLGLDYRTAKIDRSRALQAVATVSNSEPCVLGVTVGCGQTSYDLCRYPSEVGVRLKINPDALLVFEAEKATGANIHHGAWY